MAVTVKWIEFPGAPIEDGVEATNLNFGSVDEVDLNPADYPIAAGNNSYEKYWKIQWSGSFSSISNAKLFKSDGDLVAGESLKFSGDLKADGLSSNGEKPSTPTQAPVPAPDIPESVPVENNVRLSVTGDPENMGILSGPGEVRSKMLLFQLQTTTVIDAGPVDTKTISLIYDRT